MDWFSTVRPPFKIIYTVFIGTDRIFYLFDTVE